VSPTHEIPLHPVLGELSLQAVALVEGLGEPASGVLQVLLGVQATLLLLQELGFEVE
jgi:hypothetical protein